MKRQEDLSVIIATDCGSTTTKAILIERTQEGYRQTFRAEAPTTVEAPFEDVTRGVLTAFSELEEISGRKILDGERIITPSRGPVGVDLYVSTSSAGGGLQMMVAGAVLTMTAESAARAALGAGAIVMDVMAANDGRPPHEKIERIRRLRPDLVLLSGGTDGGTITHVVELAEYLAAAHPTPRLGATFKLPVIFAGNKDARPAIKEILGETTDLHITENIRPVLERENLGPAREEIQKLFLEHVMAQAPGYRKLVTMTGAPIMPTPAAVGLLMHTVAKHQHINVLGVDIGGATTDVFSVVEGTFNRTVSANLGMSYSISNVLAEAGVENIRRWVPFDVEEGTLRDAIKNKMIRPTTIPQQLNDLKIEHALAREALRRAFEQHKTLVTGLKGVQKKRTISSSFAAAPEQTTLIDMANIDLLIGSGGVLSHAPRRAQAMLILIDAFEPTGVTRLAVDSIFMMPHLGVLSQVNEQAAHEVFLRDCLVDLGTCISPVNRGKPGTKAFDYTITSDDGVAKGTVMVGQIRLERVPQGTMVALEVHPGRGVDIGEGAGRPVRAQVRGGVVGIVFDGRGRPLVLPADEQERKAMVHAWSKALDAYPA